MNPFKKLIETGLAIKSVLSGDNSAASNAGWTIIGGNGGSNGVNRNNLLDNNKNWVGVAVKKISDNVAQARLKLLRYDKEGKDEEVFDNPALSILARPNAFLTGKQFMAVTWAHIELTGNAFWLLQKTGSKLTGLFPLSPKFMTIVWSDDRTQVLGYKYQVGSKTYEYNPDQVFHLKTPDINNPLLGRGTLEDIADWADVDNYITEFNKRFFINGATFGNAIETETTSATTLETLRVQVEDVYKGVKNAFKTYILPKGSKFVQSTQTMKDMDMSEGDMRYRDKILSAFGVPKSVLGITESGSSRADAEAKNYAFQEFTIKPKLEALCDYLTEFFLPIADPSGASTLYFSYTDPTPDSKELKLTEDKAGLNNQAWLTVNEVRASRGLAPVEGGDTVMYASNAVPLGSVNVDPNAEDPSQQNSFDGKKKDIQKNTKFVDPNKKYRVVKRTLNDIIDELATKAADAVVKKKSELANTDRRVKFEEEHKVFVARVQSFEDHMKLAVIHNDRHQKDKVIRNLQRIMKDFSHATKGISKNDLLDVAEEVGIMIDFSTALLGDLWKDQGKQAMQAVNPDAEFSFNKVSEKLLNKSVSKMAKSYTNTTLEILAKQLNAGITAGESLDQLTTRVQGVYGLSEEYRAARVARTETFSVANDASRDAYKQSGVVKSVEWYTAEDELVCPYCEPMDGTVIPIDDSFYDKGDTLEGSDGGSLSLDYEGIENPPLHANCRCQIKPNEISF